VAAVRQRGTLLGAARLALLAHLAATPDEPGIRPEVKRVNGNLREEYRQITADLTRYDRMRAFGRASEFRAAALGQLGGGMLSPESWLGARRGWRVSASPRFGKARSAARPILACRASTSMPAFRTSGTRRERPRRSAVG
jgi:hypothetical protein